MRSILKRIPRVLVVQESSVQPGRDKLRGIFNYAHLYGPWHINLVHGRRGEQEPASVRDCTHYDGIIAGQMIFDMANLLERARRPTVFMDPLGDPHKLAAPFARYSCTIDDSEAVGKAGAEYFLGRGYKHFGYVGELLNRSWSVGRGEGFARRIAKAGHVCRVYPIPSSPRGRKSDEEELAAWLKSLPLPIAILAAMDPRAVQLISTCTDLGLRVPQDVAVLGIDNDELFCNGSIPTLSSIGRDTVTCGFMAAQMLDRQMRGEARKREIAKYGPTEIVTRDSTLLDTPTDHLALRAREFIHINAGEQIRIPDIVSHLKVSRRLAEVRFRAACGHSLLEELQNIRIARVEKLLKETDLPLTEICTRCGYQTDAHLRRVFKARFGLSMRDYRDRLRKP